MQTETKMPARGWSALGGKNKQGGFLQVIIAIVILLIIMRFYNLGPAEVLNWIQDIAIKIIHWIKTLVHAA